MKKPTVLGIGTVVAGGVYEPEKNVFFRLSIITYEIGDLERDVILGSSNIKLSFADVFTQLSILCKELGLDEEKIRKNKSKQSNSILSGNILILLGNLQRSIVYMKRFPQEKKYKKEMKYNLSQLLIHVSELCKEQCIDEDKVREIGIRHLEERYAQFKEDGWVAIK